MSLINKMLQDLDQRHAADGGAKTLAPQLRPVPARKNWRRIAWEVGAGVIVGAGWAIWVLYQIAPRSVVTELAFQSQAKKLQVAAALQASAAPPAAQPPVASATAVPAQAAQPAVAGATEVPAQAAPVPPAAAMPAAAVPTAPTAVPAPPATARTEPVKVEMFKFATGIATPFNEKSFGAKSGAGRKSTQQGVPAANAARQGKPAQETLARVELAPGSSPSISGTGLPLPKSQAPASIDKQAHLPTPAERAESEFRKASVLLNQGRVAEAIDAYKSSLQQDAGHAAARQALVGLLLESRRIDEAQPFVQEGLRLDPDRSAYAMLLARIQVERGDLDGAHDLLRRYAGSAANNADYHAFDAAVLQRLGRHKDAVSAYEAALRLAPRAGLWWMGMGISLQADHRGAEALEAFRRAKAAGGLSPDLLAFVDQRMKQLQ